MVLNFYAFPEIRAGRNRRIMTFILESRMLSYKFRFGNLVAGAKFTIPNNRNYASMASVLTSDSFASFRIQSYPGRLHWFHAEDL